MKKRLGIFVAGSLTFWVVLALPALLMWGERAFLFSGVAALVCVVPAALTLAWASWAQKQAADQQTVLFLGGSGLRMFAVLGISLILAVVQPEFQQPAFWLWLVVFYFFTLGLEMTLLLAGLTRPATRPTAPSTGADPSRVVRLPGTTQNPNSGEFGYLP